VPALQVQGPKFKSWSQSKKKKRMIVEYFSMLETRSKIGVKKIGKKQWKQLS
jgi:hypothetical protein